MEVLQLWTDVRGPDHPEVAHCALTLAHMYLLQGMYDASRTLYAQVVESLTSHLNGEYTGIMVIQLITEPAYCLLALILFLV